MAAKALGITLVEMLVVITIVGILMSIGVPSYRYVTNANRIAAEANSLLGDLQFARGEAIKEGSTVTACISTDQATCSTAENGSWQQGWIVFSDQNSDQTVDAGDAILRVAKPFSSTDTFVASGSVSAISFNREGFATGIPNGTVVSLHDATANTVWTRCLIITLVGLMSIEDYNQTFNGSTCT